MAYTITFQKDPLKIGEREKGESNNEVRFTKFTSCIGILSLSNNLLQGIHLVLTNDSNQILTVEDANQILTHVPNNCTQIKLIGQISVWETSAPGPLETIQQGLKGKTNDYDEYPLANGTYGGKIDGNEIELTYF